MSKINTGLEENFARKSLSELYGYLVIFAGCSIAMLVNLVMEQVGADALIAGSQEDKKLFVLTVMVVTICVFMGVFVFRVIKKKKENEKPMHISGKKRK
jgi:hypothetical protein